PPDWSKLAEILKDPKYAKEFNDAMHQAAKDGKIPENFAKKFDDPKFAGDFGKFMQSLKGGAGDVTADQMAKFLPKDAQDQIANGMVKQYAQQMNIDPNHMGEHDPGKLALAMFLGRVPDQNDAANPSYQKFMDAADNMYKIALARSDGP